MKPTANPRFPALLAVLLVGAYSALAGCYTVLKHPPSAEVLDGGEARRDCFDCHGTNGPAHAYDPMVAYGFNYLDDDWYGWYAYPWWYRDYWYSDRYDHGDDGGTAGIPGRDNGGNQNGSGSDDDPARRHLWGRGSHYGPPSLPPLVGSPAPPAAPGPAPASEPKKDDDNGRTMKPGASSGNGSQGDNNKNNNKDNKDDKKDKSNDRNVWKRGGSKGGGGQ